MTQTMTINSTDAELLAAWSAGNDAGQGEPCGAQNNDPAEAVEAEDWTFVRMLTDDTTGWGEACLADDGSGSLYVVCAANGPWAVKVA